MKTMRMEMHCTILHRHTAKNEDMENAKIYYQKVVELYKYRDAAANSQNYLDQYETDTRPLIKKTN